MPASTLDFYPAGLADRREDMAPHLDYELDRFAEREGNRVTFNTEARDRYLAFAGSPNAHWIGNFRDLAASITRMATFSPKGRIDVACVEAEFVRLRPLWLVGTAGDDGLEGVLPPDRIVALDPFDRIQLAHVVETCRRSRSLSEAGRSLFAASLAKRVSSNDADRLRKYLQGYDLTWQELHATP